MLTVRCNQPIRTKGKKSGKKKKKGRKTDISVCYLFSPAGEVLVTIEKTGCTVQRVAGVVDSRALQQDAEFHYSTHII